MTSFLQPLEPPPPGGPLRRTPLPPPLPTGSDDRAEKLGLLAGPEQVKTFVFDEPLQRLEVSKLQDRENKIKWHEEKIGKQKDDLISMRLEAGTSVP